LWLFRRNNRLDEGIVVGNKMIRDYPNDGRFYHGLALCHISQVYRNHEIVGPDPDIDQQALPGVISTMKNVLAYVFKARECYEQWLKPISDRNLRLLLIQNILSICNSIADTSIRLYTLGQRQDLGYLRFAREAIDRIKQLFTENSMEYEKHAVYNNTEAEIEYYEALYYYSRNEMTLAHNKIIYANKRMAIFNKIRKRTAISDRFSSIGNHINQLTTEIITKK